MPGTKSKALPKIASFPKKNCGYTPTTAAISAPKQEAILQCSQVAAQCRMQMLSQAKSTMHELRLIYKGARLGQPDSSS